MADQKRRRLYVGVVAAWLLGIAIVLNAAGGNWDVAILLTVFSAYVYLMGRVVQSLERQIADLTRERGPRQ